MSPKVHPGLNGKGIDYSWGKAKQDFRQNNDCVAKNLHENVKSFLSLPLGRVRSLPGDAPVHAGVRKVAHAVRMHGSGQARGVPRRAKFVKASKTHLGMFSTITTRL